MRTRLYCNRCRSDEWHVTVIGDDESLWIYCEACDMPPLDLDVPEPEDAA